MMRSNIEELPALIKLANELGASQVTAQHAVIYEGCLPEDESLFHHQEMTNRILIEARRIAARSGILFNAPPLFDSTRPQLGQKRWLWQSHLVNASRALGEFGLPRMQVLLANTVRHRMLNQALLCRHPWEVVVLDIDGNLKPCMNWSTESPLGNCSQQTYAEVWASDGFAGLRDELTGKAPLRHTCRHCHALFSGRVNKDTAFEQVSL
jgi:radical SAM protein with 4Fe4S-binding SPASM domain